MVPVVAADADGVARAAAALASGAIIGLPTDTVYGLAALPTMAGATAKIFEAKRRPHDLVLPVLVGDATDVDGLAQGLTPAVERLVARHWPGPLTLILDRAPAAADFVLGADGDTIGLRCPDHDSVRDLCRLAGPLATTSANLHGEPPLTTASAVASTFSREVALVLDGGVCDGDPSTVIDCTGPTVALVREGRLSWPELSQSL